MKNSVFYVSKTNKKIARILRNIKIIVIRYSKSRQDFAISMPCMKCKHFLHKLGISKIEYTGDNGEFMCSKVKDIPEHESRLTRSKSHKEEIITK